MWKEKEIWKDVVGYESLYKVSNWGRVISKGRYTKIKTKTGKERLVYVKERVLKGCSSSGYRIVELLGGKRVGVHVLVLEAFIGPCPLNKECTRHLDGNSLNNHLDNLCWGTYTSNNRDKILHGTITKGIDVCTAKLDDAKVKEIRERMQLLANESRRRKLKRFPRGSISKLCAEYGVGSGALRRVFQGVTWKHVV